MGGRGLQNMMQSDRVDNLSWGTTQHRLVNFFRSERFGGLRRCLRQKFDKFFLNFVPAAEIPLWIPRYEKLGQNLLQVHFSVAKL